jgi:pyroglutamyl-peptidase
MQVAGEGSLRLETRGHKYGYDIPDADDELAPIVDNSLEGAKKKVESEAERLGRRRLGFTPNDRKQQVVRGFGAGYEQFPEELFTG